MIVDKKNHSSLIIHKNLEPGTCFPLQFLAPCSVHRLLWDFHYNQGYGFCHPIIIFLNINYLSNKLGYFQIRNK